METKRNYDNHLPADQQDVDSEDVRQMLYDAYGNHVFESFEDFCDRQANALGEDWIYKLTRK